MQIYVQKHHVAINQELVDETKMKVTIESLRNEMEIRYELALKQFYDKLKIQMNGFVEKEELNNRLYEKLHKREFDKHFDRLYSTMSHLETTVSNAIPAMKEELKLMVKGKVDLRTFNDEMANKCSTDFSNSLKERIDDLTTRFDRKGISDDGSSEFSEGSGSGSDDGGERRRSKKEKVMKGSASMEDIKNKKGAGGLGAINEEEEEKESIKSGLSEKAASPKKEALAAPNKSDVSDHGAKSAKGSTYGHRGGGEISAEYKAELEAKFEDINRTIEDIKFEQTTMQQNIDKTANELTLNKMASLNASPAKDTKNDKAAAANAEENKKKIKEIETAIQRLNEKFSSEIENLRLMQNVGGGGGDDNKASQVLFDRARREIETKQTEFEREMRLLRADVNHALTDTQGLQ